MTLTLKQEAFAEAYVETGNACESYRRAYDVSPDCKPRTIEKRSGELLKNGAVTGRLAELKAANAQRHEITVDGLIDMAMRAYNKAMGEPKGASAAVSAVMAIARITGNDKGEGVELPPLPQPVLRIEYAIVDPALGTRSIVDVEAPKRLEPLPPLRLPAPN